MAVGIPGGYWIGSRRFRGRGLLIALINTGMGLPPVVVGLVVYILISRSGPLADAHLAIFNEVMPRLLYTVPAMVIAQVIISTPLVTGVTLAAVGSVPAELRLQARSLGASWLHEAALTLKEARWGVMSAVAAGFGGIISEVGAVNMVGGNIAGKTRVMTTAIMLETGMGNFGLALGLGIILLGISFVIMNGFTRAQQSGARYER
jgi:tungstate transport system permease protein